MIYNIYIYNKHGVCLLYHEWKRANRSADSAAADQKLMFGFLFSLKQIVSKLTPDNGMPGFHSCSTNKFKLNYYETATGLRFILNTDPQSGDMRECLRHIYSNVYVEFASKNPLYKLGEPLNNELFVAALDKYARSLPAFTSAA
ncbi:trafficking protein particle complex subunit 1 [Pavlovales sp. CCMP2436]|nr:trafficking protein particle complex subunit 1 [Pavlovales sp. CCMP2436]|mmetsp:Transcript_3882/g.9829  ORF Transcript_3882/g.9829 Transcript_3882/m.9829 type:complete len:144 (+) Transcript_3882:95-526(+)